MPWGQSVVCDICPTDPASADGNSIGVQPHRVSLTGDWWAGWQTQREGVEDIRAQQVRLRQHGELIQVEATTRGRPVEEGGYLWHGELSARSPRPAHPPAIPRRPAQPAQPRPHNPETRVLLEAPDASLALTIRSVDRSEIKLRQSGADLAQRWRLSKMPAAPMPPPTHIVTMP